jgi:hypothetical protein
MICYLGDVHVILIKHRAAHCLLGLFTRRRCVNHFLALNQNVIHSIVTRHDTIVTSNSESLKLLKICSTRTIQNHMRSWLLRTDELVTLWLLLLR